MPESVQQPVPQPQVTTTPKSTNWKKIGLTIVFILVAVGVVVGIYWFFVLNKSSEDSNLTGPVPKITTKTSTESAKETIPSADKDETANWKTYTNIDYHYSLKIPPSMEILKEEKNLEGKGFDYFEGELVDNVVLQYSDLTEEELQGKTDEEVLKYGFERSNILTIHIEVVNGVKSDFAKYAEKGGKLLGGPVGGSNIQKTEIGGASAYKVTYPNRPNATDYYIEHKNDQVIISINENRLVGTLNDPKNYDELFNIFDQILSTFKFLD